MHCPLCASRRLTETEHEIPGAMHCLNCGAINWPGQRSGAWDDDTDRLLAAEHHAEQWDEHDRWEQEAV